MDFKNMFSHKWHVWFNHGMGQADVYAPTLEDACKEALAWSTKQKTLLDTRPLSNIINKVEQVS